MAKFNINIWHVFSINVCELSVVVYVSKQLTTSITYVDRFIVWTQVQLVTVSAIGMDVLWNDIASKASSQSVETSPRCPWTVPDPTASLSHGLTVVRCDFSWIIVFYSLHLITLGRKCTDT